MSQVRSGSCAALTALVLIACADREPRASAPAPGTSAASAPVVRAAVVSDAGSEPVAPLAQAAEPAQSAPHGRVYAKTRFVWIRPKPRANAQWIGYLWIGGSVPLAAKEPVAGSGCKSWYAIEPRGYVCVDGERATIDPADPVYAAIARYAPKLESPWPHQYAESRGAPRYRTLPSEREQRAREGKQAPIGEVEPASWPQGSAPAPPVFGALPRTIHEDRTRLQPLSTLAYSTEVQVHGRSFLLSHDFTWVPRDRVTPYPVVQFRGVELGKTARLPLAFFRGKERPKLERGPGGELTETGRTFARLSFVELTGKREVRDKEAYLETREPGIWVRESDAVVPKPRGQTPWGSKLGEEDTSERRPRGRATWIEASILQGWLIAFEGTRPVYATLISPGRGGVPVRGRDPLETASTPTGRFSINGKFATATMEAPNEFIHSDVPWTQNFTGPYAIHSAYWHDDWGNRKSAGCVNVSPVDGRWLFEFTEPRLPEGWHGVRWQPWLEPATILILRD